MDITGGNLQILFSQVKTTWAQAYLAKTTWHDTLATTETSGTAQGVYAWMQRMPALRKWLGPRTVNALASYSYTLVNDPYEDTIAIDRFKVEDDQYGIYAPSIKIMGEQAKKWPDYTLTAAIQAGVSTPIYDGANFFDTQHPVNKYDATKLAPDNTAVQSNNFSLALTADNFAFVMQAMMSWVGEDGKPLGIGAEKLLLVVPPQLKLTAMNILNASFIAPSTVGGNTQVGANENVLKGAADLLVLPELAGEPTTWYLLDTSRVVKPFIWQLRKAPELVPRVSPTDPVVFDLHQYVWGIDARGAAGYSLWWLAARSKP